jgi:hypothetical protein
MRQERACACVLVHPVPVLLYLCQCARGERTCAQRHAPRGATRLVTVLSETYGVRKTSYVPYRPACDCFPLQEYDLQRRSTFAHPPRADLNVTVTGAATATAGAAAALA